MALFYGIYRIFMEKETNYSLNRFYLVGTIFLSLILPVLPLERIFTVGRDIGIPTFFIGLDDQGIADSGIELSNASGQGLRLGGLAFARIVYLCGISLLISTLLAQLIRLVVLRRVGKDKYGPLKIIFVNKKIAPFSILNRVFVNQEIREDPKMNTILYHEYAHFRLLHFIDLLVLEFITIFQWFNPITWLYVRSLREIHEYQADAAVIRSGEGTGTYKALLVNQLTGTEVFRLANGFSKSLTKKRMIMMTKMKSKKGTWLKVLLAVPVLAILLIAYATNSSAIAGENKPYVVKGQVIEAEGGEALAGVSVIWKGTTNGTVTDMDGKFTLEVKDKEATLVFSFVGFKTAVTKGAGEHIVRMERKIFKISEDWNEAEYKEKMKKKQASVKKDIKPPAEGDGDVFFIVEELPKFQGRNFNACQPYVQEHLEYPVKAKDNQIQGKVIVRFVVNGKGEVQDAKVLKGVDPLLDKAALKAVYSMPSWEPGRQRGKPVSVQFVIPVVFSLGEEG